MLGHHLGLQRICILHICDYVLSLLSTCEVVLFSLYFLNTIDLFIVAFNSAIADLGNSILKTQNGFKFPSLPVFILYTILVLF